MRRTMMYAAVVSTVLALAAPAALAQERTTKVAWNRSYSDALKVAQRTGKPVLIDFSATWCPPCRAMEREVWPDDEVIAVTERFVCVAVDIDANEGLAMRYRAQSIPTIVLADPWGNQISRNTGYLDASDLVRWLGAFPSDFSQVLEYIAVADKDPENAKALTAVGQFYRSVGALDVSNKYYDRALKTGEAKTNLELREQVLLVVGLNHLKLGNPGAARKTFERCLRECQGGKRCDTALLGLLTSQIDQGKLDEAEKTFAELKAKFPDSSAVAQAERNLAQAKDGR